MGCIMYGFQSCFFLKIYFNAVMIETRSRTAHLCLHQLQRATMDPVGATTSTCKTSAVSVSSGLVSTANGTACSAMMVPA